MKSDSTAQTCTDINLLTATLPLLVTKREAQEVLRSGRTTIETLLAEGELKAVQRVKGGHGSRVLILRSSIESFLKRSLLDG